MSDKLLLTANKTVTLLKEKGLKIATAESCTGGMLSSLITSVSGASSVIELGITSYSSRIKNKKSHNLNWIANVMFKKVKKSL